MSETMTLAVADDLFERPYIDLDEERVEPFRYRYVHGGFDGTETRFSFYFPPQDIYEGRFFQHITPVPESEHLALGQTGADDKIGTAFSSGAFFVETNGGGAIDLSKPQIGSDPTIGAYRANAAVARYAKVVAQTIYGEHKTYGYAYGGSGGGFRTIGCAENTRGVWDGFVPYVIGSPVAIPNVFTVRMHAMRVLRHALDGIVDALEPGSSKSMFDGLDEEERAALEEVTRMGFPPRAWRGHRTMGTHAFGILYRSVEAIDPTYFEDFWTKPGYLGSDPRSSVHRDRVQLATTVAAVYTRAEAARLGLLGVSVEGPAGGVDEAFKGPTAHGEIVVAIRLAEQPRIDPANAIFTVTSGEAAGSRVNLQGVTDDLAIVDFPDLSPELRQLAVGDIVEIDNSNFLAAQTYHRHQVPAAEFTVWDQFRGSDGKPLYPQRDVQVGPLVARAASGTLQSGDIADKMIVVESLYDREAFPWQADWYASKVRSHLGPDTDDHLRVWMVDRSLHADVVAQEDPGYTVSYLGVVNLALRQVAAWAEDGIPPAASTHYEVIDGQVIVPDHASERLGVQHSVRLTANGSERADVAVGEDVTFCVEATVPSHVSRLVEVSWDLDGSGTFAAVKAVAPSEDITVTRTAAFARPGTYFVTVRVTSQPDGDATIPFARIDNLARARVVVRD